MSDEPTHGMARRNAMKLTDARRLAFALLPGAPPGFSGHSGNSDRPHRHIDLLRNNSDFSQSNTLPRTAVAFTRMAGCRHG
ncbi:MAG: hypothetical protein AB7T20_09095 [Steroidobacteraceae bacterium]